MPQHPTIVLVGRMNVGKSTLFNRLVNKGQAIVSPIAGTTRDRKEGVIEWMQHTFTLVDTGGIDTLLAIKRKRKELLPDVYHESSAFFTHEIKRQTQIALLHADIILFLVDGREGLMPQERVWARTLLKTKKTIVLAVNKIERKTERENFSEFWKLGLGEPHPISALTGAGTGDLLDIVSQHVAKKPATQEDMALQEEIPPLRLLLLGKPNVGKSSLMNAFLNDERVIVSPIPHTTREPIDIPFTYKQRSLMLIDTAGIRKRGNIDPGLEKMGVHLSLEELDRADVALFVIESHVPLGVQDLHLGQEMMQRKTGVIIVANKWDLFQKNNEAKNQRSKESHDVMKKYTNYLRRQLPHLAWAPILFVSAKTKRNIENILDRALMIHTERHRVIPEATLQAWIKKMAYRPSSTNEAMKKPHVYGLKQTGTAPPEFTVTTEWTTVPTKQGKQKGTVRDSYIHFLENRLRATFAFEGTPIVVKLRTLE